MPQNRLGNELSGKIGEQADVRSRSPASPADGGGIAEDLLDKIPSVAAAPRTLEGLTSTTAGCTYQSRYSGINGVFILSVAIVCSGTSLQVWKSLGGVGIRPP